MYVFNVLFPVASGYVSQVVTESQISPIASGSVPYCDDGVSSEMAANFRNYMTHLSQLSPDHDNRHTQLFDTRGGVTRLRPGNENWSNSMVDMCSSESDSDDSALECDLPVLNNSRHRSRHLDHDHSDLKVENSGVCEIHGASHLRRNPHFPYEAIGTPRLAWGETPREAWSDHSDDTMYDSLNPYALFNLPKSSQRGKRKQKPCSCRNHSNSGNRSTSPDNGHGACVRDSRRRNRNIASPTNDPYVPHSLTGPIAHEARTLNSHGPVGAYSRVQDDSPGLNTDSDGCINPRGYSNQHEGTPQPSTSSGIIGHTRYGSRILGHSKSLPIFSSQESMDTNSETGESSDTDIDVMSVNQSSGVPDVNHSSQKHGHVRFETSRCNHAVESHGNHTHDNNGIVRPKAIKLESGQKYHTCDNSRCDHHLPNVMSETGSAAKSSIIRRSPHNTTDNFERPFQPPGHNFPSSESRILHVPSNQPALNNSSQMIENRQSSVIKDNTSRGSKNVIPPEKRKTIKDMHNSVIRGRLIVDRSKNSCNERSIDLTGVDTEETGTHENSVPRCDSPVLPEVILPSTSDDSDIEVVRIETNRYVE